MDSPLKETALLLPETVARWCMETNQDLIGLMRMSVKVLNCRYNGAGLLYLVQAHPCDIDALLDLGFMEWE